MSVFCKVFGHTWVPVTISPERRWYTTKAGHTLKQGELVDGAIRHLDRCARCGAERDTGARRHDDDEVDVGAAADDAGGEGEEEA